jgi:hypothetical protein
MSKVSGSTKTVSSTTPPSFQQPYLNTLFSEAQKLYNQPGPSYFPGSTVAGFTDAEKQAQSYLTGTGFNNASTAANQALSNLNLTSTAMDVDNNPYLAKAAEGAVRPIFQQLTESVLPNLRSGFMTTGALGSSRQGLAEGLATGRATQQALDTTAQMYNSAYNKGLDFTSQMTSLAPAIQGMQGAPADFLAAAGGQERAMNQAQLNDQIARYQYDQNLPYQKLTEFANLIRGSYGGQGTAEVQTELGDLQQILGAGMTLLPLIQQIYAAMKG